MKHIYSPLPNQFENFTNRFPNGFLIFNDEYIGHFFLQSEMPYYTNSRGVGQGKEKAQLIESVRLLDFDIGWVCIMYQPGWIVQGVGFCAARCAAPFPGESGFYASQERK